MVFQLFFPAHQLRCFILTFFTEAYVFFLGLKCRRKEVFVLCFIANPKSRFQNLNPHFPIECTQPAIALTVPVCLYTACFASSFRASSQSCARWISLLSLKLGQTVFYSNFKVCRFELFRQVSSLRIYKYCNGSPSCFQDGSLKWFDLIPFSRSRGKMR